jgi:hypothetical protein
MGNKKPLIKFNNGKPIALCNRCFSIMCFVSCPDGDDLDGDNNCVVIERRGHGDEEFITTPLGEKPPVYCKKCEKFLKGYFLN